MQTKISPVIKNPKVRLLPEACRTFLLSFFMLFRTGKAFQNYSETGTSFMIIPGDSTATYTNPSGHTSTFRMRPILFNKTS